MNERPIIFSGPMVRAILEGRKTQTRLIRNASCGTILICHMPIQKIKKLTINNIISRIAAEYVNGKKKNMPPILLKLEIGDKNLFTNIVQKIMTAKNNGINDCEKKCYLPMEQNVLVVEKLSRYFLNLITSIMMVPSKDEKSGVDQKLCMLGHVKTIGLLPFSYSVRIATKAKNAEVVYAHTN